MSKRPPAPNPMFALVSWRGLALSVGCALIAPFGLFVGRDQVPMPFVAILIAVAFLYLARELVLWATEWRLRWLGFAWAAIAGLSLLGSTFAFLSTFGFANPLA